MYIVFIVTGENYSHNLPQKKTKQKKTPKKTHPQPFSLLTKENALHMQVIAMLQKYLV